METAKAMDCVDKGSLRIGNTSIVKTKEKENEEMKMPLRG